MEHLEESFGFENLLENERPRLVRLCAWFTGNQEVAEDLAQETLIAAWKSRDRLIGADKIKPWLSAIARNVCLNWSRQHYREQSYVTSQTVEPANSEEGSQENDLPDGYNMELDLDRSELARLLDQALGLLPAETAQMLVEHYILESSHAEIADKMGMNAGAVAVRLQRGKLTLQRLLRTRLQAESAAFGLFNTDDLAWEETNIWCPTCGQAHMLGQYQKDKPEGRFALRCPRCNPHPEEIQVGLDLTYAYNASLLGNIKSYKPAYTRLITYTLGLFRQAVTTHAVNCPSCGRPAEIMVEHQKKLPVLPGENSDIRIICYACGWASNKSRSAMMMALPEAQRFWRENPRIRILPMQEIESQGSAAILTRLQSITSAAELAVLSTRDTFDVLGIHSNLKTY